MKRLAFFAAAVLLAPAAWAAVPSDSEIQAFNEEIQRERTAFEAELRRTPPPKKARDVAEFQKKRIEEAIAFQQSIAGLDADAQVAAIADFQTKRLAEETAFDAEQKKDSAAAKLEDLQKKRAAEASALEARIQGMPPQDQEAALDEFEAKGRAEAAALDAELKKAAAEEGNLQVKRRDFDRKMAQKIRAFYDR